MRNKRFKYFIFSLLFCFVTLSNEELDVGGPHSTEPGIKVPINSSDNRE